VQTAILELMGLLQIEMNILRKISQLTRGYQPLPNQKGNLQKNPP
jgi:hypothetical protein